MISDQVEIKIFYDTEINSRIVLMRESVEFRTGLPNPNYRNQDVFPKNWRQSGDFFKKFRETSEGFFEIRLNKRTSESVFSWKSKIVTVTNSYGLSLSR